MSVRAKFKVINIEGNKVLMNPVYSDDPNNENKSFWDATPAGEITLYITNEKALEQFVVNQEYYVDFNEGLVEKACEEVAGINQSFDFGYALNCLRNGKKVARKGWNGKGMFAVYQKGYPDGIPCNNQTAEAWGLNEGDLFKVRPYLQLKTVQGDHVMWTPSTSDILADDWEVVE